MLAGITPMTVDGWIGDPQMWVLIFIAVVTWILASCVNAFVWGDIIFRGPCLPRWFKAFCFSASPVAFVILAAYVLIRWLVRDERKWQDNFHPAGK
jgi:hypothetical protein